MMTHMFNQLITTRQAFGRLVGNGASSRFYRLFMVSGLLLASLSFSLGQSLSVSMRYPAFRSSFITGSQVNIQVTTTTPASTTVTKVEFFLSTYATGPRTTTKLGEDLTAPFSYTWTIPDGQVSYNELSAVVTNSTGATAVQGGTGYIRVDVYPPTTASNKKYYVQASASPSNTAGTLAAPFNTIQKAAELVQPGDSVFVLAGTYTNTGTSDVVTIRRTGTPARWITFTNYQNDKPKLSFNGWQGFQLTPGAAYISIRGFEIEGNNKNVTLSEAQQQPGACEGPNPTATGSALATFNGNGISLSGRTGGNARPHHILIANNTVHDCGGGGISAIESDYVTIENNTVYNTSWYTIFGSSGISILNSWNYDTRTDIPRIIIRNNRCYGNRLFIKWNNNGLCKITDGNGIILDNNNDKFSANPLGAYTGQFLVENNLSYLNGGRGININYSDNVSILNNTCYQNAISPEISSELVMNSSRHDRIYNNIFYGRSDRAINIVSSPVDISFNNNLTFGGTGTPYFSGAQNIVGVDPQFVDAANGDFQLASSSPAINAGNSTSGQYALNDILGLTRPQGAGVDIGAFEFQTPNTVTAPFAITGVTTVSCQTMSTGQRVVNFTPNYTGLTGQPVSFSVVNELASTTNAGPYTLSLYADNPVVTLKAGQQGTNGDVSYSYNWFAACNGSPFAITAVTTVSCQTVSTGQWSVSFTPRYAGLSGQPVSFSVVNELAATSSPGPYTLSLYADNPTIVLEATQAGTPTGSTFSYNWLAACRNSGGRLGVDGPSNRLDVRVLGNPVREQVLVEIRGAVGQPLQLQLTDSKGFIVENRVVELGAAVERHVFDLRRQPTGLLVLRVSTNRRAESVKVLKQ